jgi:hypothetical protein
VKGKKKVNGACPVKKKFRRTKAQIEQLDRQIVEVLKADHPQTVRHVFYRMTDPRLPEPVPKTDKGKNNGYEAVQRRMVRLRRDGRVPYNWVTDMSRRGYFVNTYGSAAHFLKSVKSQYRADLWHRADYYVEVWVESRSIASVVLDVCQELAVDLYPAGGDSSISFAHEAAQIIRQESKGRQVVVLYVGDYDPAGVHIDASLERELRLHLDDCYRLDFRRVAITEEQIEEYDLPTKPRKETDTRAPHILETVEAEAMPAHVLRELLRQEIEDLLPERALEVAKVAEAGERELLQQLAERMFPKDDWPTRDVEKIIPPGFHK